MTLIGEHEKPAQGFEDSRRLTGPNLYLPGCGVALETLGETVPSAYSLTEWQALVLQACAHLQWTLPEFVIRRHKTGASLAFSAPADQLYTGTEINEWAWLKVAKCQQETYSPAAPNLLDDEVAFHTLQRMAEAEANPHLITLIEAAEKKNLPTFYDDEFFSIGEGQGSQTWLIEALPGLDSIDWQKSSTIPTALITGSNGKTTTTRLVAAMCREQGWHTGHNCTDGLFLDGVCYEEGDYSGPMGARSILRNQQVQAGVLETARGGILRRGLAVQSVNVAAVTNISADHFGEYGIHDLSGLADVKLVVARALDEAGVLVLNADDAMLMQKASQFKCRHAYFSLQENNPLIAELQKIGGTVCELIDGHLYIDKNDLGAIDDMPLSMNGSAQYNVENLAAAACISYGLGVGLPAIKTTMYRFGLSNSDNPGRLQRWQVGGVNVLIDYAHNPEGLHGFLSIVQSQQAAGRLALLLGQAGNREDDDIRELAKVAASFKPDTIVLKDIDGFMRGREAGEVAVILQGALLEYGIPESRISIQLNEVEAVRTILQWAEAGDILALPIHSTAGRAEVEALMQTLNEINWCVGDKLPERMEKIE
ncbi:MAG: Mur ligase family protein [Arenimonas sp.]